MLTGEVRGAGRSVRVARNVALVHRRHKGRERHLVPEDPGRSALHAERGTRRLGGFHASRAVPFHGRRAVA